MINLSKSVVFNYCHGDGTPTTAPTRTTLDMPRVTLVKSLEVVAVCHGDGTPDTAPTRTLYLADGAR